MQRPDNGKSIMCRHGPFDHGHVRLRRTRSLGDGLQPVQFGDDLDVRLHGQEGNEPHPDQGNAIRDQRANDETTSSLPKLRCPSPLGCQRSLAT